MGLTAVIKTVSLSYLYEKAADYKGVTLKEDAPDASSEPFRIHLLNKKWFAVLEECGIRRRPHPRCPDTIFTLVDENPQEKLPELMFNYHGNCWEFKLLEGDKHNFDLRLFMRVDFGVSIEKCGIVLWPRVYSTSFSPRDRDLNFRMFQILVHNDPEAPAIAKELTASGGSILVPWTELGLGGIRSLASLFTDFAAGNRENRRLAQFEAIFDPSPFRQCRKPSDELFVFKPDQAEIIKRWREQLNEYRAHLVA
jgi:hypothetical protein